MCTQYWLRKNGQKSRLGQVPNLPRGCARLSWSGSFTCAIDSCFWGLVQRVDDSNKSGLDFTLTYRCYEQDRIAKLNAVLPVTNTILVIRGTNRKQIYMDHICENK